MSDLSKAREEQKWWSKYVPDGYRLAGWTYHRSALLVAPDGMCVSLQREHIDWADALLAQAKKI